MAEAMITGFVARQAVGADGIIAADVSGERLAELGGRHGIRTTPDNAGVVREAPLCIVAVKPQQLDGVLRSLVPEFTPDHLVVSIAAGKTTAHIEALLPGVRVIRVMPNIPCLAGEGMNVFTRGRLATPRDAGEVARLLRCCGQAAELPESLFDAVTALSGSGPAFFAYVLDRFVEGAVKEGMPRDQALLLATQTMLGTARLLMEKRWEPADLAAAVTSAKGTTAAGREVLETPATAEILVRTIGAAARRSRELGKA